jgi:hypothetical protein
MTLRALVFVRYAGAFHLGHVGWAFEYRTGWFNAGAVENVNGMPHATPQEMGFWTEDSLDPVASMQRWKYDAYKVLPVAQAHPAEAWRTIIWLSRQPYVFLRRNCVDDAYDVLRAYGVADLALPSKHFLPNRWFAALPGEEQLMKERAMVPLSAAARFWRMVPGPHTHRLEIPPRAHTLPPPWRMEGNPVQELFQAALDELGMQGGGAEE